MVLWELGGSSVVIPQLPSKFQCHQTMLACGTVMGNNCNRLSPWLSWICSLVLGVCVMRSAQEHQLSQTPLFWPVWGTREQNVWVPLRLGPLVTLGIVLQRSQFQFPYLIRNFHLDTVHSPIQIRRPPFPLLDAKKIHCTDMVLR